MNFKATPTAKYAGTVLQLKDYLGAVPNPPSKTYYEYKVKTQWEMDGNDSVGDCTCACIAHMIMLATAHTGIMFVPSTAQVLAAYSAITGYNGDPSTDNGANITDVLNYWQKTGIAGHKIVAWAAVDPSNLKQVEQAIWLFGGVDIGIEVYQSMMDQTNAMQPWDNPSGSDLGGHSIPLFGYGSQGTTGVTWGALQQMGWPCFQQICSEAYCAITQDWINQLMGKTYSGFDLAQLQVDLAALGQQSK